MKLSCFMIQASRACVIKVFVLGKPFQPSLMFASKARAYLSEAPLMYSTLSQAPHPQTLDKAGKACQGQTLQLITKICKFRP